MYKISALYGCRSNTCPVELTDTFGWNPGSNLEKDLWFKCRAHPVWYSGNVEDSPMPPPSWKFLCSSSGCHCEQGSLDLQSPQIQWLFWGFKVIQLWAFESVSVSHRWPSRGVVGSTWSSKSASTDEKLNPFNHSYHFVWRLTQSYKSSKLCLGFQESSGMMKWH